MEHIQGFAGRSITMAIEIATIYLHFLLPLIRCPCPKHVGSFGYSTDFLNGKTARSDNDLIRKVWA